MTKWTPQQEAAIADRGRSVIVSAAAGSGKTAVLVERLLRILSDTEHRVPAESIVVVTFTNDAAAQMKQRLYQALSDKLSDLEGRAQDEDTALWLMRQQSALSSAKISTINAFCFDLIRENADICGVSSQFTVAEPSEEAVYVRHALQEVLDRRNKECPEEMEMLYDFFCTRSDEELETVILQIADYMKSLAFPDQWIREALRLCEEDTVLVRRMLDQLCDGLQEVLQLAERSRRYAEEAGAARKNNEFLALLEEDITNITFHRNMLLHAETERILENPAVHTAQFRSFPTVRKDIDPDSKAVFQQFREMYKKKYTSLLKDYLSPLQYFAEDSAAQRRVIPPLLALTQRYCDALFAEKLRRNVLSFDDGERLALSLLGTPQEDGSIARTALGDMLSQQYSLIMVDEYQDSNNKQDCLFKLLSRDCGVSRRTGKLSYGRNAFLVGDVKQSIYSFRLANPQNFTDAIEESTPYESCQPDAFARIYLNRNFRSAEGVIRFVNGLFSMLMTEQCGEVLYNEDEYLNFGAVHYSDCPDTRTQLLFPHAGEETACEDIQAVCIAETIADMLHRRVPVMERDGSSRACRPEDFCILLRSVKKDGVAIQQALQDLDIPVNSDEESSFLMLPEIAVIRDILRILDNPLTDMAMAGVLLSPVGGFTAEDLALLKARTNGRRLYLQMMQLAELTDFPEDMRILHDKCTVFLALLAQLRTEADMLSLEDLIQRIYDCTDLLSLQSLYEDADKRRCHLQDFRRYAGSYRQHADLTAQSGVSGWLRHLDNIEASGKDLEAGQLPPVQLNAVAVKTIHKSKGLEYPFVFLAHTERPFFRSQSKASVLPDSSGLLGLRLLDRENYRKSTTAAYHVVLADTFRKQRSEEMRLFYVALTRAKQQLFLVMDCDYCRKYSAGAGKAKEGEYKMIQLLEASPDTAPLLAAEAGCMADWILQYLLAAGKGDALIAAMDDGNDTAWMYADFSAKSVGETSAAETPQKASLTADADSAAMAQMAQQLAFRYTSPQTALVSKYSVTALAHAGEGVSERLREPAFLQADKNGKSRALRGADRGTAVHKLMQYMDFAAAAKDPQAELQRLLAEGMLTAAEYEAIGDEKLRAFFASELYSRIAASPCVYKEKQFFVKIGELDFPEDAGIRRAYAGTDGILIGTMDLLFREGGGWVLVDYKTDYTTDAASLLKRYSLQLGLYCKAAARILGEPVHRAYIYAFTLDRAIALDPDSLQYDILEADYEHETEN